MSFSELHQTPAKEMMSRGGQNKSGRHERKQFASAFHGNYYQQNSLFLDRKSTERFVFVPVKERERQERLKDKRENMNIPIEILTEPDSGEAGRHTKMTRGEKKRKKKRKTKTKGHRVISRDCYTTQA